MSTQISISNNGKICFCYSPRKRVILEYAINVGLRPSVIQSTKPEDEFCDYIERLELTEEMTFMLTLNHEDGVFILKGKEYKGTCTIVIDLDALVLPSGEYVIEIIMGDFPEIRLDLEKPKEEIE